RSPIALAPASDVAVPMTMAPCAASSSAIAAPMPRLAPVTSAISPVRGKLLMCFLRRFVLLPVLQRGVEISRCTERACVDRLVDALDQSGQHLAGAALGDAGRARRCQCLYATGPLHRQVQLAYQRIADRIGALVHRG